MILTTHETVVKRTQSSHSDKWLQGAGRQKRVVPAVPVVNFHQNYLGEPPLPITSLAHPKPHISGRRLYVFSHTRTVL
jgi:hypothetical protein